MIITVDAAGQPVAPGRRADWPAVCRGAHQSEALARSRGLSSRACRLLGAIAAGDLSTVLAALGSHGARTNIG